VGFDQFFFNAARVAELGLGMDGAAVVRLTKHAAPFCSDCSIPRITSVSTQPHMRLQQRTA